MLLYILLGALIGLAIAGATFAVTVWVIRDYKPKYEIEKGNWEWASNPFTSLRWRKDPNGKFQMRVVKYNWFEKLLIRYGLVGDMNSVRYVGGADPVN